MKKIIVLVSIFISIKTIAQQKSTLYVKGGQKIIVSQVKKLPKETSFFYKDSAQKLAKTSLPNWLIDSIVVGKIDTAKVTNVLAETMVQAVDTAKPVVIDTVINVEPQVTNQPTNNTPTPKEKNYSFNYAFGITLGNFLEFNNPTGIDKKGFSLTASLDLNYKYFKPNALVNMSHELHYTFGVQRESLSSGSNFQRVQDDLLTLHDFSIRIKSNSKWSINTIAKFSTSLFTVYDGEYFKDVTGLGKIKAFNSPYSLSLAPGIKYDFSSALKVSLSPYSFELYGVQNDEIRNKGIFITDVDGAGNFKNSIIRKQGFEMNIWFDKNVKDWLEMQYRLSVNSDYAGGFGNNGIIDGLFLTRFKIAKSIYLTHRATLNNTFNNNFWKPFFTQTIQLSYNKSL